MQHLQIVRELRPQIDGRRVDGIKGCDEMFSMKVKETRSLAKEVGGFANEGRQQWAVALVMAIFPSEGIILEKLSKSEQGNFADPWLHKWQIVLEF